MTDLATARRKIRELWELRRDRVQHPVGDFDSAGRWYPHKSGKCTCCEYVREPSRAYPYTMMVHCRTKIHIQNLLRKRGEI